MSRTRRLVVGLVSVACFVIGAIALGLHPDHRWQEITGEPEHVPIQVSDNGTVVTTRFE